MRTSLKNSREFAADQPVIHAFAVVIDRDQIATATARGLAVLALHLMGVDVQSAALPRARKASVAAFRSEASPNPTLDLKRSILVARMLALRDWNGMRIFPAELKTTAPGSVFGPPRQ